MPSNAMDSCHRAARLVIARLAFAFLAGVPVKDIDWQRRYQRCHALAAEEQIGWLVGICAKDLPLADDQVPAKLIRLSYRCLALD